MGKESLTHVFGSGQREIIQTGPWYESLRKLETEYSRCKVVSFTRVKNLSSKYMHEYVQFIVQDTASGDRARVFADRANEKVVDIVTIGWDRDEIPTDPEDKQELPLPLYSVKFAEDDQPTVLDIANILAATTIIGGHYEFYKHNCFWFANLAFKTVRMRWKSAQDKNWRWVNPGGHGGGGLDLVKDAWGLGFPTLFKFLFVPGAKEFREERTHKKEWGLQIKDREEITPLKLTKAVTDELLTEPCLEEYKQWRGFEGSGELDKDALQERINAALKQAEELSESPDLDISEKFDQDVHELAKVAHEEPEAESLLQLVAKTKARTGLPADPEYEGPRAEQFAEVERALDILVGKILQSTGLGAQ